MFVSFSNVNICEIKLDMKDFVRNPVRAPRESTQGRSIPENGKTDVNENGNFDAGKGSRQKTVFLRSGWPKGGGGLAPSALTVSKCENFGPIFPIIKW